MSYNYAKLAGKIVEKFDTQANFAEAMCLSERSISLKLNGKVGWKQAEIIEVCKLLEIEHSQIPDYFFNVKVQD